MERSTVKNSGTARAAVFLVTVVIAVIIPVNASHSYSEVVSVSCYQEGPDAGVYIGGLTVPVPDNAGQSCNSMYAECNGKCVGCVSDFDISEDVCYDSAGRKFLK